MRIKSIKSLTALSALLPMLSYAQVPEIAVIDYSVGSIVVCVLAGILLASAFQFLLTNLSVALGITAVGDISETSTSSDDDNDSAHKSASDKTAEVGVKVFTGLGIFMTITMSISLFFATMIASKLSLVPFESMGIYLGLVIWAGFVLLSLYLDAKMVGSMGGGLLSVVKSGLDAGTSVVSGIFSSSPEKQMKNIAREGVRTLSDEISKEFDTRDLEKKLDTYVKELSPQEIDIKKVRKELAKLIHDIEVKEQYTPDDEDATKKLILEVSEKQPTLSSQNKSDLSNMIDEIKSADKEGGSKLDKAQKGFDKLSPGDEKEGEQYRQKLADFLNSTDKSEVSPDELSKDLSAVLDDPKTAPTVLRARLNQLDKNTIKAMLSKVDGMDDKRAGSLVDMASGVVEKLKTKYQGNDSGQPSNSTDMVVRKEKSEGAVQAWFNDMNKDELSYSQIKMDAKHIMDDPSSTPQIVRSRLAKMDKDSLVALLSNNPWMSEAQAERVVEQFEGAKSDVVTKVNQVEIEVNRQLAVAKREGLNQAEALRKSAAAAAWWLFIAIVVSGGAAALGGSMTIL